MHLYTWSASELSSGTTPELHAPEPLKLGQSFFNEGLKAHQQGRYTTAETLYRKALTLYEDVEGAQADRDLCTTNLATSLFMAPG